MTRSFFALMMTLGFLARTASAEFYYPSSSPNPTPVPIQVTSATYTAANDCLAGVPDWNVPKTKLEIKADGTVITTEETISRGVSHYEKKRIIQEELDFFDFALTQSVYNDDRARLRLCRVEKKFTTTYATETMPRVSTLGQGCQWTPGLPPSTSGDHYRHRSLFDTSSPGFPFVEQTESERLYPAANAPLARQYFRRTYRKVFSLEGWSYRPDKKVEKQWKNGERQTALWEFFNRDYPTPDLHLVTYEDTDSGSLTEECNRDNYTESETCLKGLALLKSVSESIPERCMEEAKKAGF